MLCQVVLKSCHWILSRFLSCRLHRTSSWKMCYEACWMVGLSFERLSWHALLGRILVLQGGLERHPMTYDRSGASCSLKLITWLENLFPGRWLIQITPIGIGFNERNHPSPTLAASTVHSRTERLSCQRLTRTGHRRLTAYPSLTGLFHLAY